ncbi:SDR family oxidoreductase [Kribbella sp. NPDC023855]|uniref:SDR family oxidoreductase n=1 Tax=Kribbella sp. NPDC023855 TaxID=3154698 RepID=UPI0033EB0AD5
MTESRIAVVTGAASGIGAAIATRLAADGAAVALLARRAHRLEKLAAQIVEAGGRALAVPTDITDPAAVERAAATVQQQLGDVDLLVNSAGLMKLQPFGEVPVTEWQQMVDVNLKGLLEVTHAFLPALKRSAAERTTDLVNISSLAADRYMAGMTTYGATKAAVTYWSRSIRAELAPDGIRVTNVEPGMTGGTELADDFPADLRAMVDEMRASLSAVQPEELADVVAYIASRPRHVNLSQIVVQPSKEV